MSRLLGDVFQIVRGNVGIGTILPTVSLDIQTTDAIHVPSGSNIQRPNGRDGLIRYNTQLQQFEGYSKNTWGAIGGGGETYWSCNQNTLFYSSNNVGIGTNNAQYRLDVSGTIRGTNIITSNLNAISLSGAITDSISTNSSTIAASATAVKSAYDLAVNALPLTGGTVTGNVNILGNLFTSNLTVVGDYVTMNTVTSNTEQMVIENAGTGPALKVTQTGAYSVAEFYDKESGLTMILANNGNIGIGSTLPNNKLDVLGNVYIDGNLTLNNSNLNVGTGTITASSFIGTATQVSQTLIRGNYLTGNNYNGSSSSTWAVDATTVATANKVVARDASGGIFASSLGIGTTVAQQTLQVEGISYLKGNVGIGTGPSDVTSTLMFNSGDTSTPTDKLYWTYVKNGSKIAHYAGWNVAFYAGQSNTAISPSNGNFRFLTGGPTYNERLTILNNGNVGIGSTQPIAKLDVQGSITASQLTGSIITDSVSTTSSTIAASATAVKTSYDLANNALPKTGGTLTGNLGIGTTLAYVPLYVQGDAVLNGTVSTNNHPIDAGSATITAATFSGTATQVSQTLTRGNYLTGNNYNGGTATTWAVDGTTTPTANKIVARDASGGIYVANIGIGTTVVRQLLDIEGGHAIISGNVGIGTTNPRLPLHIIGSRDRTLRLEPLSGTSGNVSTIQFYSTFGNYPSDTNTRYSARITSGFQDSGTGIWGSEYLAFGVGNNGAANDTPIDPNEKIRITCTGNVGIGTTNPLSKLHVYQYPVLVGNSTDTDPNRFISMLDSSMTNGISKYICIGKSNTLNNQAEFSYFHSSDGSTANFAAIGLYGGNYFYVTGGGKVGIGKTNPQYSLEVVGDINYTGTLYQNGVPFSGGGGGGSSQWTTSGTMIYYNGGNVGIGTTNPLSRLHVYQYPILVGTSTDIDHGRFLSMLDSTIPNNTAKYITLGKTNSLHNQAEYSYYHVGDGNSANYAGIGLYGGSYLHVTGAGNVGIGVTNPHYKLEVNGDTYLDGTVITNNNNINAGTGTITATTFSGTATQVSQTLTRGNYLTGNNYNGGTATTWAVDGTTTPTANKVVLRDASGNMYSGNLGIGTTQVGAGMNLDVIGNARLSGSLTAGSLLGSVITDSVSTTSSSIAASATAVKTSYDLANNALPKTGGTLTGNVNILGNLYASNLMVVGDYVTMNTVTSNTEQIVITNAGTGPALKVTQSGPQPVAEFYDNESGLALTIANNGNIGIGSTQPGTKLDVLGNVYINGDLNMGTGTITATTFSGTATQVSQTLTRGNYLTGNNYNGGTATTWAVDGTTTPTANKVVLRDASGDMYSGNLGIGTTQVGTGMNLDVIGNARLSGSLTAGSLLGSVITDSVSTTSSSTAASATAVKTVYDIAVAAFPNTGGYINGYLFASNIATSNLDLYSTGALKLPSGSNVDRPSGLDGYIRYNKELQQFEGYSKNSWGAIGGGTSNIIDLNNFTANNITTSNLTILNTLTFSPDSSVLRNRLQVNPLRKITYVETATCNEFYLETEGIFGGHASNVDVYIGLQRLLYYTSNITYYNVNYTHTHTHTQYTIQLTEPAVYGDLVDITVWPQMIQASSNYPGYVYQQVIMTYFEQSSNDLYYTLGNVGIGTSNTSLAKLTVGGHIYPSACNLYDLGSSNYRWRDIYLSGNTIDLDGTRISKDMDTGGIKINSTSNTLDFKAKNMYTEGTLYTSNIVIYNSQTIPVQVPPIRSIVYVDTPTRSTFILNTYGLFGGSASNVFVYKDNQKLTYVNSNINDYTLSITYDNQAYYTFYTITLTQPAIQGNVLDITVWPTILPESLPNNQKVYQRVDLQTDFISGVNSVYYMGGNVGIGTNLPTQTLDVRGNIRCSNISVIGDFVTLNTITSNTEQMVIENAGTGPALKVTQTGDNSVAEFYDKESGVALYVGNGGNVGIGTTVPTSTLHVNGLIKAANIAIPGTIVQTIINKITTETILTAATSYTATTILATITPKYSNSILMIQCNVAIELGGTGGVFLCLYRDDALTTDTGAPLSNEHGYYYQNTVTDVYLKQTFTVSVTSGNTNTTTFKIYGKRHGAPTNVRVGCPSNSSSYSGRSEIIIQEIAQ